MGSKLFSVIIPTLNCASKIERTIESVLNQPCDLVELIIVDGASSDETLRVIERYAPHLRVLSEPDEGVYDAMNKGIGEAQGKYLYFLGAGDRLYPGVLGHIAPHMPQGKLSFVYGDVMVEGARYGGRFTKGRIRRDNISHQAIFYERTIFDLLGVFELRYRTLADYVFNLKCFGCSKLDIRYISHVIADFEVGGMCMTTTDFNFLQDYPQLLRRHLGATQYVLHCAEVFRWRLNMRARLRRRLKRPEPPPTGTFAKYRRVDSQIELYKGNS